MEPSMGIGTVYLFEDNKGAIKLAVASRRTKHIDVKHNLVRVACDAGKVRVVYIKTEDQHADLFTKPLDIQMFYNHATTVLNVVLGDSNVGVYCERCKLSHGKDRFV